MLDFAALWSRLQPNLDRIFGETLEVHPLLPRNRGNQVSASAPDPNVPPFTVVGMLTLVAQVAEVKGARNDATKAAVAIDQPLVSFDPGVFGPGKPAPKKGDRIVAVDRPQVAVNGAMGPPAYIVDAPAQPDGVARIAYKLREE